MHVVDNGQYNSMHIVYGRMDSSSSLQLINVKSLTINLADHVSMCTSCVDRNCYGISCSYNWARVFCDTGPGVAIIIE